MYTRWISAYGAASRERILGGLFPIRPLKYLSRFLFKRKASKYLWSHGIGRHTEQELYEIAERDLLAVSEILDQEKFLFGDKPCLADAALFAFIAACTWDMPESPIAELTKTKAKNLEKHAQRMKELYYPDWDEMVSKKLKTE